MSEIGMLQQLWGNGGHRSGVVITSTVMLPVGSIENVLHIEVRVTCKNVDVLLSSILEIPKVFISSSSTLKDFEVIVG
jgi:hypothetical protein